MIDLGYIERRIDDAKMVVLDCETSGLNWRKERTVGFVITFSGDPSDSHYLPVRHEGGGNLPVDRVVPMLRRSLRRQTLRTCGFNYAFDLHFLSSDDINLDGPLEDAQLNAYLLNENARSFSLDACCRAAGVQEKLGEELYQHMAARFGGTPDRKQMANFWRLAGDDPVAADYAVGDGTSTWQLWEKQQIALDDEKLRPIWELECRVIRVLHRMTTRGIKIDEERIHQVRRMVDRNLQDARARLPKGFNERAPSQLKSVFTGAGVTDWPLTVKGNASFTEGWLHTNELGRAVVAVRKLSNLKNSFLDPLEARHVLRGRVHCDYNQGRNETHGTVTGRLSASNPNLQQCVAAGTRVTIPGGYRNIEDIRVGDWVYTYDDDLKLSLRRVIWSGQTGIRRLVRVSWRSEGSKKGGGRPEGYLDVTPDHEIRAISGEYIRADVIQASRRVRWKGRSFRGGARVLALHRSVVVTKTAGPRNRLSATGRRFNREARFVFEAVNGWSPELVHHVDEDSLNDSPDNLEARTVSSHSSEHLSAVSSEEKRRRVLITDAAVRRRVCDAGGEAARKKITRWDITIEAVHSALEKSAGNIHAAARALGCGYSTVRRRLGIDVRGNHVVTRVHELPGEHPVYDITVEGTHNFIANEVCVHNCPKRDEVLGPLFRSGFVPEDGHIWGSADESQIEPRLLAHFGQVRVLLDGYRADPPVDAHSAVAGAAGIDRQSGKTLNQALITGSGDDHAIDMLAAGGVSRERGAKILQDYFRAMPEIKNRFVTSDGLVVLGGIQRHASNVLKTRGYLRSLLGRKARLDDVRFAYKALNRLLQMGNADVLKRAMADVDDYLISEGDDVYLLNNVHDSLDISYPPELEYQYREALRLMEDFGPGKSVELSVPLLVEEKSGANWAEASYGVDVVRRAFDSMGGDYLNRQLEMGVAAQ